MPLNLLNHFRDLIQSFDWHNPSWSLFIILFWLVASVVYAFAAGRGRILTILISVYMAKLLVIEAPFIGQQLGRNFTSPVAASQQLFAFLVLFLVLFLFLARYAFKTAVDIRRVSGSVFGLIFSVLQVGLLINIIIGFLPQSAKENFAPLIKFLFVQDPASFIWLIAPVIFLIFLGKFVSERTEI